MNAELTFAALVHIAMLVHGIDYWENLLMLLVTSLLFQLVIMSAVGKAS